VTRVADVVCPAADASVRQSGLHGLVL